MIQTLSGMFNLNLKDLAKGLIVAVFAAILGGLQQLIIAHGFDFANYDWNLIIGLAGTAFTSYLGKNLLTDQNGKVLGKI